MDDIQMDKLPAIVYIAHSLFSYFQGKPLNIKILHLQMAGLIDRNVVIGFETVQNYTLAFEYLSQCFL